jgi:hypothetical protein
MLFPSSKTVLLQVIKHNAICAGSIETEIDTVASSRMDNCLEVCGIREVLFLSLTPCCKDVITIPSTDSKIGCSTDDLILVNNFLLKWHGGVLPSQAL